MNNHITKIIAVCFIIAISHSLTVLAYAQSQSPSPNIFNSNSSLNEDNENWNFPESWLGGANANIEASVVIDGNLYVSGGFSLIGNQFINRIARYDIENSTWHSLEGEMDGVAMSLIEYDSNLILGGYFDSVSGSTMNSIAMYNTETDTWHSLGDGLNGPVLSLMRVEDDIYVGGTFTEASGVPAGGIARYNMETEIWHAVGTGTNHTVSAMVMHGTDLYMGGNFSMAGGEDANRLAKYDTETGEWDNLNFESDFAYTVALEIIETYLYVGGRYTIDGVSDIGLLRYNLAEEQWEQFDEGLIGQVISIKSHGSNLIVGGYFETEGNDSIHHIAKYNTGDDLFLPLNGGTNSFVRSFSIYGDKIYAGGGFTMAGDTEAHNIAAYDFTEDSWDRMVEPHLPFVTHQVNFLKAQGENVYIVESTGFPGKPLSVFHSENDSWYKLDYEFDDRIVGITVSEETMYISGFFTEINGQPFPNFAGYNFETETWFNPGIEFDNIPTLVKLIGDHLYVSGIDSQTSQENLLKMNIETEEWEVLGNYNDMRINQLIKHENMIYLGGHTINSGVFESAVIQYDKQTETFSKLNEDITGILADLELMDGYLYASGSDLETDAIGPSNILRFSLETESWNTVGSDLNRTVHTMTSIGGELYAGGQFNQSGTDITLNSIARYSPVTDSWYPLGSGTNGIVVTMAVVGSEIYIGGNFQITGNKPSVFLSRWDTQVDVSVEPGPGETPQQISLRQNYPNPFNPETTITYSLPESSEVQMELFNINGQRVATLVNSFHQAGTYSLRVNASHLASGIYIYRLRAGGEIHTRKMTVIK